MVRALIAASLAAVLAACAVGPNYHAPTAPDVSALNLDPVHFAVTAPAQVGDVSDLLRRRPDVRAESAAVYKALGGLPATIGGPERVAAAGR